MRETNFTVNDRIARSDLINVLKANPDGRFRRGVRYPQWILLLVGVLRILSGGCSSRDLESFAHRHREAHNDALGLEYNRRWPSDATILCLYSFAEA